MKTKHTPVKLGSYTIYASGEIVSEIQHGKWKGARAIKPLSNGDGYYFVRLTVNGKRKKWLLHKLIAECFLTKPDHENAQIRHLDGNTFNNNVNNLAWGTAKENAEDRMNHGRTSRGLKHSSYIKKGLSDAKANAHLIAAAPEMLEALELAANILMNAGQKPLKGNNFYIIDQVIKKARGES